jgi:hypothetical protein
MLLGVLVIIVAWVSPSYRTVGEPAHDASVLELRR